MGGCVFSSPPRLTPLLVTEVLNNVIEDEDEDEDEEEMKLKIKFASSPRFAKSNN